VLPAGLTLAFPWALLALPLVLLLPRSPWRWLRLLALALLIAALAGPSLPRSGGREAVLVDVSDSVGAGAQQAARAVIGEGGPHLDTYYFAGDTARVAGLGADVPPVVTTGATDLARALQVAAASGANRALLVSDGIERLKAEG